MLSDSGTPGDGATDDADPVITGSGSLGDTITLSAGGLVLGSTIITDGDTWSIASSDLKLGTYTLTATQTDGYGDVSDTSSSLGVTIVASPSLPDDLALAASSDSGTQGDDATDIPTPTITGTGTPGETITLLSGFSKRSAVLLKEGAAVLGTGTVTEAGTWSVVSTGLDAGNYELFARQTDSYGNVSFDSDGLDLTIVSPPDTPSDLALAAISDTGTLGDDLTTLGTPTITGTGHDGDTVTLYDRMTKVGTGTVTGDSWSITSSVLSVGAHILTATEMDGFGNGSEPSSALTLQIVAIPGAPGDLAFAPGSDSGFAGDGVTDISAPTVTGAGMIGHTVTLYDGQTVLGATEVDEDGIWSLGTGSLTLGAYALTAVQTDSFGNVSGPSAAFGLTIVPVPDTPKDLALAAASDSGMQGDDITDSATVTITGSGTAGGNVALYDGQTLAGIATVASDGQWSSVTTSLSSGAHTFTAQQRDSYGDVSAGSDAVVVTILAPPTPPSSLALAPSSDGGLLGDGITNDATPAITGAGIAGDSIALYDGTSLAGTTTVGKNGLWSMVSAVLADGPHTLTAQQTDAAGDISAASVPVQITIDTVLPPAPTLAETVLTTNPAEPVLDGMATSGDVVTVFQNSTQIGTTTAANGMWQVSYTSPLSAGTYALTATDTDVAGNVSAQPSAATLIVAADKSYTVVTPIAGTATQKAVLYSSAGSLAAVQTQTTEGLVLTSATSTQALINIYDNAGTLIGTVRQPTSTAFLPPNYDVSPGALSASTIGGTLASTIDLLSEQNTYVSHGDATITVHAGSATIVALGHATTLNALDAQITFYGGMGTSAVYGGQGQLTAIGGAAGGTLIGGSAGNNVLASGGGTTTLVGMGSGDTLFGSAQGTDTLFATTPNEILVGNGGTETLVADDGSDAFGGAGSTTMFGSDEDGTILVGGAGTTVMVAGTGNITMWAGTGVTTIWGGAGDDVLSGNAAVTSTTTMIGGSGNNIFLGGGGISTATGGTGNDTFFVGAGKMTIFAGAGQDSIVLGSGTATIHGGTGTDIYALTQGSAGGTTIIDDFKVGVDHLDLFSYAPDPVQENLGPGSLTLSFTDGSVILLAGVTQLDRDSIR